MLTSSILRRQLPRLLPRLGVLSRATFWGKTSPSSGTLSSVGGIAPPQEARRHISIASRPYHVHPLAGTGDIALSTLIDIGEIDRRKEREGARVFVVGVDGSTESFVSRPSAFSVSPRT